MCGIAGIVSKNSRLVSVERLQAGLSCLAHRGLQGRRTWINPDHHIALGHHRLSIIDLSEKAGQPMHYRSRFTVVHNGEVYNYEEIREQLKSRGHEFVSTSDTEVLVAAYAEWGTGCLQHFDGMFAFVIWDEEEKTVFAARDRFGEKPFYFFYDDEQLAFGSEMKSLWSFGLEKEVNTSMLYNFLTIGYGSNPSAPEETFFKNISSLPAASYLVYNSTTHELSVENYWRLYRETPIEINEEDAVARFDELFSGSIQKRLRSDVEIGTSLSGGLDSSAIVAYADALASSQYKHQCFTAVFNDFDRNESEYASQVASQFQLRHHLVEMDREDIPSLMQKVMHHQEEPFGSGSVLAQYKVYEAARQNGVTVLLDGQGADEILAGYHKYYKWYWQELYRQKQLDKSGELEAARKLGVKETFGLANKTAALLPDFAAGIHQARKIKKAYRNIGLNRDFAYTHKRELYYSTPIHPDLNGALFFNTFIHGLGELLKLADRNSMAHATEVRLPFLNHELVTFLFSLPSSLKIRDGWTKWLLRKAVENRLPPSITWRRDKTGFEPPQEAWMKRKDVQESIYEGKNKLVKAGILDPGVLKKHQPHSAYAADWAEWRYWSASFLY